MLGAHARRLRGKEEGADPERKHEANNADADCKPSRNASARHHWPNRIGLRQIG